MLIAQFNLFFSHVILSHMRKEMYTVLKALLLCKQKNLYE